MVSVAVDPRAAAAREELAGLGRQSLGEDLLLSLVRPQPVALSRLKTGIRISSRPDGKTWMRTSPVWPLLLKA